MENRKQLLMSGVFLLAGIIVILFTIVLLGGNSRIFHRTATAYIKFDQVQGLNPGAVVSLAGLPVGNVVEFDFDGKQIKVEVEIKKSAYKRLTQGTEAEIRTQGALGDKYIYLTAGDPDAVPLEPNAEIPAKVSTDILSILSEKSSETEKIFDIITETHVLLKSLNEGNRAAKIMANLEEGSDSFKKFADRAQGSAEKFDRVMSRIDQGEGTLGALISDSAIHDQIKSLLGASQRKSHVKSMLKKSVETSNNSER